VGGAAEDWLRPEVQYLGQRGRCPLCGDLLLHADQEPRHPDEWELWIKAVRIATRHQAISLDTVPGKPGGPAVFRLTHAHCTRRQPGGASSGTSASAALTRLQGLPEPGASKRRTPGS